MLENLKNSSNPSLLNRKGESSSLFPVENSPLSPPLSEEKFSQSAGIIHRIHGLQEVFLEKRGTGILGSEFRSILEMVIEKMKSPVEAIISGREVLLFGTNSYLGLNFDPRCIEISRETVQDYGTGSTASRIAGGNQKFHLLAEKAVADLFGDGFQSVVFSTGFMANLAIVSSLVKTGYAIFLDSHCHASIVDAARLSGAKVFTFSHNDPKSLESLFKDSGFAPHSCLVIVEGLYSVWGDLGNILPILEVTKKQGGVLVVDEAHSFGLLGKNGGGLCQELGVEREVDVLVGTFSKCVGVVGGFCVTSHPAFEVLRCLARPYLYTASLPPSIMAAAWKSLEIIQKEPERRKRTWENGKLFCEGVSRLGFSLYSQTGPVGALPMPTAKVAFDFWQALLENGIYMNVMIPPSTPDGKSVLRFSISAAHTPEMISFALETLAKIGRSFSVIAA